MHRGTRVEATGHLAAVSTLFPPGGFWGLKSDGQARQRAPVAAAPFPWPCFILISIQSNRFSVQAGIESCGAGLRTQSESGWLPSELPCHYLPVGAFYLVSP